MSVFARVGEFTQRLITWAKTHRPIALGILGAVLIIPAIIAAYSLVNQPLPPLNNKPIAIKPRPPAPKFYSKLDGRQISDQAAATKLVTAIMLENSPDARPQSGLKQAEVVYEAIAEGGITRFLALYQQNKPGLIGPVRSLRMYYLDWAAPYQPSIAHIGGSAAALTEVRNGNYKDIDQFFNSGAYWRASDRYAPHNVYTSFERLDALNAAKGFTTSEFTSFPRIDGKPSNPQNASSINVTISGPTYNSSYAYDPAANHYVRSQGGGAHTDREEGAITPSVVIVLKVAMERVLEDGYRESIVTSGDGQAYIFQNGTVMEAYWSKASRGEPLKLIDSTGNELPLVRGQTWITAVPANGGASWQ